MSEEEEEDLEGPGPAEGIEEEVSGERGKEKDKAGRVGLV